MTPAALRERVLYILNLFVFRISRQTLVWDMIIFSLYKKWLAMRRIANNAKSSTTAIAT